MSFPRLFLIFLLLSLAIGSSAADGPPVIRVGMTPAFLHDQHSMLAEWRQYLEARLKRPVEFVQRDSYRETMDLIQQQKIEFAWICDYPYLALRREVRLLAVAMYQGKPSYRSYLIVPSADTQTKAITDLRGAVFAFADPYSNTGYLAPRYALRQAGIDPAGFFRRTFFTRSHRKAIESVSSGLAQGAAVDSYVWDSLARVRPELTARTRVVQKSEEYGFPPIVAHRAVSDDDFAAFQSVLLGMGNDPAGRAILAKLNLDGFIAGSPQLYKGVADMMRAFGEY